VCVGVFVCFRVGHNGLVAVSVFMVVNSVVNSSKKTEKDGHNRSGDNLRLDGKVQLQFTSSGKCI